MNCKSLLFAAVITASLTVSAFEWKFKDGENSSVITESSRPELNGKFVGKVKPVWAREDDRGWFLTLPSGASIEIPHHEDLNFKDGFHASMLFSCDLAQTAKGNFQNLFTKGLNFQQGYSVMIGKNGVLMLNLRGLKPVYKLVRVDLKSNKEFKLDIYVGKGEVQIFVNGQKKAAYPYTGTLEYSGKNTPLRIGGTGAYAFAGNIHYFMIRPYVSPEEAKKEAPKKSALESFRPVPLTHPAGTVIFKDFTLFQPASAVKKAATASEQFNTWVCRTRAFTNHNTYTLYPPVNIAAPVLKYDPQLKGTYDFYVNIRAIHRPTAFQTRLSGMKDYFTVKTVTMGKIHRNMDICLARNVKMDGQILEVASTGETAFINCFKFVPSGTVEPPPQDPACTVVTEPRANFDKLNSAISAEVERNIKSGKLKERIWVDEKPMPAIPASASQRGYMLFAHDWMDLLFEQSKPAANSGSVSLKVTAAKDEYEPATLGFHALKDIKNLSLRVSTALGDDVKVSIRQAESLDKRTTNFLGRSEYMRAPTYLAPHRNMSVKKGQTRQFWITVQVTADARPGIRKGELLLSADGKEEKIPLTVEILPFKLAPLTGYDIGFWVATSVETDQEIDYMIREMKAHNVTSNAFNGVFTLIGDTPDKKSIDFENSLITTIVKAWKKYGLTGNILLSSDQFSHFGTANYKRLVKDVEAHAKANNWPPIVWTIYDEVPSHPEVFPSFIANLKALKEVGVPVYADHVWYHTLRPLEKEVAEASKYIDTFVLRFNTRNYFYADLWDTIQARCAAEGKKLYAYNSNNAIVFPQTAAMRFAAGWFFRSFGKAATGQLIWTYNSSKGSPYTDLDHNCVDWYYIYPEFAGYPGGFAIDYEALREGGDDMRYIQTLEQAIAAARKDGRIAQADRAQKLLDSLAASFDKELFFKKSVYFSSHWEKKWEKDGKRYASGRYNLPTGWNFEQYANARKLIAQEIIKLMQK